MAGFYGSGDMRFNLVNPTTLKNGGLSDKIYTGSFALDTPAKLEELISLGRDDYAQVICSVGVPEPSSLKFKLRGSVTWDHGPLSLRALLTHVGGYTNNIANPAQSVGSFNPVDLSLTWKVGDKDGGNILTSGLTLGLEVRNVFNERPPYVNIAPSGNGSGGYDATAADPLGRVFAASIRKSF